MSYKKHPVDKNKIFIDWVDIETLMRLSDGE